MSYRKKYEEHHNVKLEKGWQVHHIDWNHDNNNIDNLIAVPEKVHVVIHQHGYLDRQEIDGLIQTYKQYE